MPSNICLTYVASDLSHFQTIFQRIRTIENMKIFLFTIVFCLYANGIQSSSPVTTPNGCTCAGDCQTSPSAFFAVNPIATVWHFHISSQYSHMYCKVNCISKSANIQIDWCPTKDQCGSQHKDRTKGYFDFCQFKASSVPEWTNLSWQEKMNVTWQKIISNQSSAAWVPLNDMKATAMVTKLLAHKW